MKRKFLTDNRKALSKDRRATVRAKRDADAMVDEASLAHQQLHTKSACFNERAISKGRVERCARRPRSAMTLLVLLGLFFYLGVLAPFINVCST
jgi:ABC-type siderophore export system fused ATPase/permease subunit